MPQNIPVGFGQATYSFTHESAPRPLAITLGVAIPDGIVDYPLVADALYARFRDTVFEDLDNGLTLDGVDLFIGAGAGSSGSVRSNLAGAVGGRAMVSMPLNTCVLVSKNTGFLGRANRGRMFVPSSGPASDVSEIGNISESLQTSLQGSWDDFYTQLQEGGEIGTAIYDTPIRPFILHQSLASAPTPITGFTVVRKIGTRPTRIR